MISNHFAVHFNLHIPSKSRFERIIKFSKVKEIDASSFATDLWKALIPLTSWDLDELSKLVDGYNQAVSSVLDQHAVPKTKRAEYEHYQPWYCYDIGDVDRKCRKLERTWRADVKNKDKWVAFNKQRKVTQVIIRKREKEYYHLLFMEKTSNHKEVFSNANALWTRNNIRSLPECSSLMELANGFNNFFVDKITSLRDNIINTHFNGIQPTPVEPVNQLIFFRNGFISWYLRKKYWEKNKRITIQEQWAGSDADHTTQINGWGGHLSDSMDYQCVFGVRWIFQKSKGCTSQTIDKKKGLDLVYKSFHPVSNLSYVSKLWERFAADQLFDYVTWNGLSEKFQSAYIVSHSTKTALIQVRNDILLDMDNSECTFLVLLDLSAAFHMLDNATLLKHLQNRFKITGSLLKWIESYLSDRSQAVVLKNEEGETATSNVVRLLSGVPQASVLGAPSVHIVYNTPGRYM